MTGSGRGGHGGESSTGSGPGNLPFVALDVHVPARGTEGLAIYAASTPKRMPGCTHYIEPGGASAVLPSQCSLSKGLGWQALEMQ